MQPNLPRAVRFSLLSNTENRMLLSDFLKAHGIELAPVAQEPPPLPAGVRLLLFLLSRRHVKGIAIALDKKLLASEWPRTVSDSLDTALQQAIEAGYVTEGSSGYSLTDLGKKQAI